ncbi:MAG: ABC transporter permease [Gammaproteobacteria bacterium]
MPKPLFLWTDILIWLLVGLTLLFAWHAARHAHLRAAWGQVLRSRTAMAAAVVLVVYVLIGLADSVHFNPRLEDGPDGEAVYSSQVVSLLDLVAAPLLERREKTYSAPLATRAFVKESVELPDGSTVRDYPRLVYGGAHLEDPARDWLADVVATALLGALAGLAAWGMVLLLLALAGGRRTGAGAIGQARRLMGGDTELPWYAALWALLVILALAGAAIALSGKYHLLGTDKVGQDVFYQAVKSIRTGLVIGTLTTLVMLPAALILGISAGYFKGWVDDLIQYLYTTLNSIPSVLLIAAAVLLMHLYMSSHAQEFNSVTERADLRLLFLCAILGVTSWTSLCRLLRGETFKLRELEYVQAAHAMGVRHATVLHRHILPNVMHIVLITVVLDFSGLVLAEAVLSYINIGVDPSTDSWGNMINSARLELAREPVVWWSLAAAFVFMFTLVLAANLFADAVRDAFDPRLRNAR